MKGVSHRPWNWSVRRLVSYEGVLFKKKLATHTTRNTKNRIFAIPAAEPAIPPKPNTPAMSAKTKNVNAQFSIMILLKLKIVKFIL